MDFKGYFQEELMYIKELALEFSRDYPELEAFLSPNAGEPEVQALFEHFALLSAKARQKVEDAFPEITHPLLERLFPLPLSPLPALIILSFSTPLGEVSTLPNGIHLYTHDNKGKDITFSLARELTILPLTVVDVTTIDMPDETIITLRFHYTGKVSQNRWITLPPLSFFLGDDAEVASQLQLWFSQYLHLAELRAGSDTYRINSLSAPLMVAEKNLPAPLLPTPVSQYNNLQLVTDWLCFRQAHHFLTLDFSSEYPAIPVDEEGEFALRFHFNHRLILNKPLTPAHFQLNCVPALNLFTYTSQPQKQVNLHHLVTLPHAMHFHTLLEVSSAQQEDNLSRLNDNDAGQMAHIVYQPVSQFLPRHHQVQDVPQYYQMLRSTTLIEETAYHLTFIDAGGKAVMLPKKHEVTCVMNCTQSLSEGVVKTDNTFFGEAALPNHLTINAITTNTASKAPNIDAAYHWQLISALSLSNTFLSDVNTICELLADLQIYDRNHYALHNQWLAQIKSIQTVCTTAMDWVVKGTLIRGLKLTLTLSQDAFPNEGECYRFGCLIAQILPFCLLQNNVLMTDIINSHTQQRWSLPPIFGKRLQM